MNSSNFEKLTLTCYTLSALSIIGAASAAIIYFVMLILALTAVVTPLPAQTSAAMRYEAAVAKEQVDGDLKTAMDAYEKIAADPAAGRDLRARSLLRLAGCQEKIGQQAKTVYERIVREFGDRPEAAQARNRLAALGGQNTRATASASMTLRRLVLPTSAPMAASDTDGQRAYYGDAARITLSFGDLSGHASNVVLKFKPGTFASSLSSRDMSQVAIGYLKASMGRNALAVVRNDGSGYRELPVQELADPSLQTWSVMDWSWDKRSLLVYTVREQEIRLLIVSVADGSSRVLMKGPKLYAIRPAFSPDGRFVAYSRYGSSISEFFVVPTQGGEPRRAYQIPALSNLVDWTADGRYLILSSQQSGSSGLYLLPVNGGQATGEAMLVRYGSFVEGRTTASGALVYMATPPGGSWRLFVADLGVDGPGIWRRLSLSGGNGNSPYPTWSPDASAIAYVARNDDAGQNSGALMVQDISSGRERQMYKGSGLIYCTWGAGHSRIVCSEFNVEKTELFSIDPVSGARERLQSFSHIAWLASRSQDDAAFYLGRISAEGMPELVRWDVASQQETILAKIKFSDELRPSQDGRWLLRTTGDQILIRSMSSGDFRVAATTGVPTLGDLTTDGKSLLYRGVEAGKPGLFRVSLEGGSPQRLGDIPETGPCCSHVSSISISPDGKHVFALDKDLNPSELWILENFVPKADKPK